MLSRIPDAPVRIPKGLGLRLLKLPIGLAKPLLRPIGSNIEVAGATTEIWSPESPSIPARIAAALSRTEGTDCSSCSVVLDRGMRWGSVGWLGWGGEGEATGSISRSNIADEEECL